MLKQFATVEIIDNFSSEVCACIPIMSHFSSVLFSYTIRPDRKLGNRNLSGKAD